MTTGRNPNPAHVVLRYAAVNARARANDADTLAEHMRGLLEGINRDELDDEANLTLDTMGNTLLAHADRSAALARNLADYAGTLEQMGEPS